MKIRKVSITARLTLLFALTSATVLIALGLLITQALNAHFAAEDRALLTQRMDMLHRLAAESGGGELRGRLVSALGDQPGLVGSMSMNGEPWYSTPGVDFAQAQRVARKHDAFDWQWSGQQYRGVTRVIDRPGSPGRLNIILGLSTEIHDHFLHGFNRILLAFVAAATLVSGLLGWWAARQGLAPLRAMSDSAQAVTRGNFQERMPVQAVPVEIAELAGTLNTMLDRLERDFKRLADFSSDIAHELRTPITNMMTQTHVTLAQPRDGEKYRDILVSNSEEMQRLARMISDMLYLAKTENGLNLPSSETVLLENELAGVIEFYDALAEDRGLKIMANGAGAVIGDRLMIRRAFSNVLANAINYAEPASQIICSIYQHDGLISLRIGNSGPDIPAKQLLAIFDRFFRVDKSRTRPENEGVGLGLSITQAIVLAHRGNISAESAGGKTNFTLSFPATNG